MPGVSTMEMPFSTWELVPEHWNLKKKSFNWKPEIRDSELHLFRNTDSKFHLFKKAFPNLLKGLNCFLGSTWCELWFKVSNIAECFQTYHKGIPRNNAICVGVHNSNEPKSWIGWRCWGRRPKIHELAEDDEMKRPKIRKLVEDDEASKNSYLVKAHLSVVGSGPILMPGKS